MLQKFIQFTTKNKLLQKNNRLLLAISGGIDSIVLCDLVHRAGFEFGIAHCNFQLRGQAAIDDENFVAQLAQKYNTLYVSTRFDTENYAKTNKLSIQVAARNLRYEWFEKMRKLYDFTFIATAHHQNDVVETMIYNLTKGTGIAGLHGILPKNGYIVRPLLFTNKSKIEKYAQNQQLNYREDSSNATTKYARNKIRHLVVPHLKELNPKLEQTFADNARRFHEIETIYQQGIAAYRRQLFENKKHETLISIQKLKKTTALPSILYELLKPYKYKAAQVEQIIAALDAESGKVFYSSSHQIIKDRQFLILSEKTAKDSSFSLIEHDLHILEKKNQTFFFKKEERKKDFICNTNKNIAQIDFDKLEFPLMLRSWQDGDYFYPLGMNNKKKKLKRYFADQKMSLNDKKRVLILTDNKKRIVWVVNHRLDERFKITEKTQQIYHIQIEQNHKH
ncbi:MAG: tRNA lysidine(34) synthetase TilS [Chitinophagales bacterium]